MEMKMEMEMGLILAFPFQANKEDNNTLYLKCTTTTVWPAFMQLLSVKIRGIKKFLRTAVAMQAVSWTYKHFLDVRIIVRLLHTVFKCIVLDTVDPPGPRIIFSEVGRHDVYLLSAMAKYLLYSMYMYEDESVRSTSFNVG
jgi:hypothetical protein